MDIHEQINADLRTRWPQADPRAWVHRPGPYELLNNEHPQLHVRFLAPDGQRWRSWCRFSEEMTGDPEFLLGLLERQIKNHWDAKTT